MNSLLATGVYQGEKFLDNGLRFLQVSLPKIGKSGSDTPLLVLPNRAAGETFDVLQPGAKILVGGRLYPNRQDYKMYVVPNQPVQLVSGNLSINQVNLAGGVGFIPEQVKEDLFTFTLMCSAPAQQVLNHSWEDSLSFRIESWSDDAKRLNTFLHVGRQMDLCGVLRYNTWTAQDGSPRGTYQVRVRAGLYSVFGKGKKKEEQGVETAQPATPEVRLPLQQGVMSDNVPCSVNTDNIPF